MISLWASGIKPTLSLNFAGANTLDSLFTFTRSGAQTYFDSTGTLQTATTNVAAFDYDPSTLAPLGLSLWEARTNLFLNSLLDGTALSTQGVSTTAQAYTVSFYGTGTITFTGATTGSLVGTGATNRVSTTFTPSVGTVTCTVSGSVKWANFEVGAFATPFIATAGASATRAAPVCSTTNLGWYTQNIGTYVVAASSAIANSGANQFMARTSDNTYNNQICISLSTAGFANISTASGGVFNGLATAVSAITANTSFKAAGAFAANDLAFSYNAAAVVTDSAYTAPASATVFNVGSDHAGANHFNGWIFSLTYYPLRLPNSTLQALTA